MGTHLWGAPGARLGGSPQAPVCAATLHTGFRHVDCEMFDAKFGAWMDELVVDGTAAHERQETPVGLDGKTLRGSAKHGAPGVHLFSALAP